ncbi:MAG: SIMPL domain-containing protein [Cytophagales bacterium]|nr:SIMPL domain-containing protein [Cytophaga sp.]
MKTILISLLSLFVVGASMAQTPAVPLIQKSITVTGTAEMEVVPDEIYFRVVLKEYLKDKNKVPLDKLEKELTQAVTSSGVAKENFTIEQVYGERWKQKKSKDSELYSAKSYIIKISEPGKIDEILDKISPESIESVEIRNYSHSKIEEYKKQLKIEAIKAAKVKATYLLTAIDEQLGSALEISEYDNPYSPQPYYRNQMVAQSNVSYDGAGDGGSAIGFQKIKLQFQVTAKFAIK